MVGWETYAYGWPLSNPWKVSVFYLLSDEFNTEGTTKLAKDSPFF